MKSDGKGRKGTRGQHDDAWDPWPAISTKAWQKHRAAERLPPCEEAWRAGSLPAVAYALEICRLYRQPPPEWVIEAVGRVVQERMTKFERRRRHQDLIHLERFAAVRELRERRHELAKVGDDRGTSWERAYAAVSESYKGTHVAGSADTVKASYQYVRREIKAGRGWRFMIVSPRAEVLLPASKRSSPQA